MGEENLVFFESIAKLVDYRQMKQGDGTKPDRKRKKKVKQTLQPTEPIVQSDEKQYKVERANKPRDKYEKMREMPPEQRENHEQLKFNRKKGNFERKKANEGKDKSRFNRGGKRFDRKQHKQ